jgi:hypothetical protein
MQNSVQRYLAKPTPAIFPACFPAHWEQENQEWWSHISLGDAGIPPAILQFFVLLHVHIGQARVH